jgi:hypothetical protein
MPGTETKAPGLVWRTRSNGAQAAYWVATPAAVKAGYRPKTVRLHHEAGDPLLASRCHVLQAEMLTWLEQAGKGRPTHYDGTYASLVRFYETHPDSPYHELHPNTQRTYSNTMKLLMVHKGKRLVRQTDASDVRRWYKELSDTHSVGWAYYTINVLKSVLSFGATKRIAECRLLRVELREAKFRAGKRRDRFMTFAQVNAFRHKAHEMGYGWMALMVTAQFCFAMRRRDIIGEWLPAGADAIGIRYRTRIWRDGWTFDQIDSRGVFRKLVSKTEETSGVVAVHRVADFPILLEEMKQVGWPSERRAGPVIIDPRTGLPPPYWTCRYLFRRIATAAKIPEEVWNMDARAGANTEAYEAGVTKEEAMAMMTHTQENTNRGYLRNFEEQSHRAAVKRVETWGKKQEREG